MTVTIDGQIDLTVQRIDDQEKDDTPEEQPMSTRQMAGRTLELILRLLLIQQYRFNRWKAHIPMLTPNRRSPAIRALTGEKEQEQAKGRTQQQAGLAPQANNNAREHTTIPILSPALSMCKFWVLFDRARHLVYEAIDPLSGEGGVHLAVHYELQAMAQSAPGPNQCEVYPSYGELAINLSIDILKG